MIQFYFSLFRLLLNVIVFDKELGALLVIGRYLWTLQFYFSFFFFFFTSDK